MRPARAGQRAGLPRPLLRQRGLQSSANAAYKLIWRLADAEAIGPVLLGMGRPVHVLQRGVEVADVVNMAALCVVDAQEREGREVGGELPPP